MENEDALAQYRTNQILTASADRLILLLYEGALKAAKDCQIAIQSNNWAHMTATGRQLQDILIGLADALNLEASEATTLRDLYLYCWGRAVAAQIEKNPDTLDSVVSVLGNLSDGLRKFLSATPTPEHEEKPNVAPTTDSINLAG